MSKLRYSETYCNFWYIIKKILKRKNDYYGDSYINYKITDDTYFEFVSNVKNSVQSDSYILTAHDYDIFIQIMYDINEDLSYKLCNFVVLSNSNLENNIKKLTENELLDLEKCGFKFEKLKTFI